MNTNSVEKSREITILKKKIEYHFNLIKRGIDVSANNKSIEECLRDKCRHYNAALN
jgi:hypothetical protein